jgi:hypothetical protein
MSRRAWTVRGLGLVTFTTLIGASTGVTGNGAISGLALITQPGTYTVGQNIDLSGTNLGAGTPVINVVLANGGEVVIDLDNHTVKRGPGGPVIAISCGSGGNEGSSCAVTIRDGKVESGSENVRAVDADLRLERVTAVGAHQDGVHVTGGSLRVASSVIRAAGANAIWSDATGHFDLVDSTILNPGASGIALQEATQMELTNTVIRGAGAHGITAHWPGGASGVRFTDVRVLDAAQDGYHLEGDAPIVLAGGIVRGSGGHGFVMVGNNEEDVRISGARIIGSAGPAAMYMEIGGASVQIVDSQLRDFAGTGIAAIGSTLTSSITLERNLIASAGTTVDVYPHVGVDLGGAGSARVLDTTIEGTDVGLRVGSRDATIVGNQLRMMRTRGIAIEGTGASVRANIVAGSAGASDGIWSAEGGHALYVKDNQVRGFTTGLRFAPGTTVDAQGYFRGNTLIGNTTAVVGGVDAGGNIF